jgi:hypothetical protein
VIHLLAHIGSTYNRPVTSKHIDQCVYRCVKLSDLVFVIFDIMVTQKKVNSILSGAHFVLYVIRNFVLPRVVNIIFIYFR